MSIYLPPSLINFDPKHIVMSTWIDHLPFAYDIVAALNPKVITELGTHNGLSFFGFCQSVKEHNLDTVCYAIDGWEGDLHIGKYDNSVYENVSAHAREHYRGFTYLLKMYFNDALKHFEDESIDLLHIDGLHTYDAVKEDFENWYPKVEPGGIILFHDIMAKREDFGVWQFWEEIENNYDTFKFHHGYGLGVLRKPGAPEKTDHPLFKLLFESTPEQQNQLRALYVHAAEHLEAKRKLKRLTKKSK